MPDKRPGGHEEALDLWLRGRFLDAGRLVFQALSSEDRPIWSCAILRISIARSGIHAPVAEKVLEIGKNPSEWPKAKAAFSEIRRETLKVEDIQQLSLNEQATRRLLFVAELVAKVLYNCTDPLDPFDEDSGWWIAGCFKDFLESFEDLKSPSLAWSILSRDFGNPKTGQG